MGYDAAHIRTFFDDYGEREWERLEATPKDRVSFFIHQHYLQKYVRAGQRVLEAGAGAGRFTIELARLGAVVTVGDISPVQLTLNRKHVTEAGLGANIAAREALDITDLSRFADGAFDTVVAYGGPLSYVMERADRAFAELLRVTTLGGHVLFSVMSTAGATRAFLPGVFEVAQNHGAQTVSEVIRTGVLTGELNQGHAMKMYRWAEVRALIKRHPCTLKSATATNFLSSEQDEALALLEESDPRWQRFLEWELALCREPGVLDSGTHILAVVQRC